MPSHTTLVGVNGFHDSSRIFGTWHSSGSFGLEFAKLIFYGDVNDAIDLNFNYYGKLFTRDAIPNAFRGGPANFDVQAGFSHELKRTGSDLRVKVAAYQFDAEDTVRGWNAGLELKTRNGMFSVRYDVGNDRINDTYQTVGAYFNAGLRLDNVLKARNPFSMPEPIFHSPRNLRRMFTQKVRRDWHQPTSVRSGSANGNSGSGCDRSFAPIVMIASGGLGNPFYDQFPFPAMSYTILDPGKFIVVEFDYAFDTMPSSISDVQWRIIVNNSAIAVPDNMFLGVFPPSQSGHFAFTLDRSSLNQSAFTSASVDPSQVSFYVANAIGPTTLTLTNVCIRFNQ